MGWLRSIVIVIAVFLTSVSSLRAETGAEGWLRYAPLSREAASRYDAMPNVVIPLSNSEVLNSAKGELIRGLGAMLEESLRVQQNVSAENAFVLGNLKDIAANFRELDSSRPLGADGFWLRTLRHGDKKYWLIIGGSDRGVLFGTFAFLSRIAQEQNVDNLDDFENPSALIR
jgi:alpha-glucuronidase